MTDETLVERVAKTIHEMSAALSSYADDGCGRCEHQARAVIKEVADAVEEADGNMDSEDFYGPYPPDVARWLRKQAAEEEEG